MSIIYSVLSCKLAANFSTFLIFILSHKMLYHYGGHVLFQDIEHQLEENMFHHFLHYSFL